jgi:hypothetical protein
MLAKGSNGEGTTPGECTDCATTAKESSFDELAKGLASGTISRSRALQLMGTVVLGGVLASIPGVAWAQQRGRGGGGGSAHGRCPQGTVNCRGKCVILAEDRNNCGGCGVVCPEGRLCVGGTCCLTEQVCGSGTSASCCAPGQPCLPNSTTGELTCCPEGQVCGTGPTATCCSGAQICHTSELSGTTRCCFSGGRPHLSLAEYSRISAATMLYALAELAASDPVIASRTKGGRGSKQPRPSFYAPNDFLGKQDSWANLLPGIILSVDSAPSAYSFLPIRPIIVCSPECLKG